MADWTVETVAARFEEAVETARRLPPVRVQGYYSLWPEIIRQQWETFSREDVELRPLPPEPAAIERMMEAMRWMQWLEVEERHLVWMRAKQYEWHRIGKRFGCDRTTAWRRWQRALRAMVDRLNGGPCEFRLG